jgi:inosine-uridine nucleoside N-ribohydrolase
VRLLRPFVGIRSLPLKSSSDATAVVEQEAGNLGNPPPDSSAAAAAPNARIIRGYSCTFVVNPSGAITRRMSFVASIIRVNPRPSVVAPGLVGPNAPLSGLG